MSIVRVAFHAYPVRFEEFVHEEVRVRPRQGSEALAAQVRRLRDLLIPPTDELDFLVIRDRGNDVDLVPL